jgi:uncharacterized iron-regulated membrane protein
VMLSVTGIVIWWRKRRSRVLAAGREAQEPGHGKAVSSLSLSAQPPAHQ